MTFNIRPFIASVFTIFCIACDPAINTESEVIQFEGSIVYDYSSENRFGEMSAERQKQTMGDQLTFTLKGNKYKQSMNGSWSYTQYYLGQDTMYVSLSAVDSLYYTDATLETREIIEYDIQQNAETIAGILCDLLTYKTPELTVKYYFNKKYPIKPENFKKHAFEFISFWFERTQAMPLKIITESPDFTSTLTAKEIKEIKISDAEFTLPDLPRQKSPNQ